MRDPLLMRLAAQQSRRQRSIHDAMFAACLAADRLSLVIESAVRTADPTNYPEVLSTLMDIKAAIAQAAAGGRPR